MEKNGERGRVLEWDTSVSASLYRQEAQREKITSKDRS